MRSSYCLCFAAGLLSCMSPQQPRVETANEVETELRAVVQRNFSETSKEDLHGILDTIHAESPARAGVLQMESAFNSWNLRVELVAWEFLGNDDEIAVARVSQKTTKLTGPQFVDNILDSIYVFRKDDSGWKLWNSIVVAHTPVQADS